MNDTPHTPTPWKLHDAYKNDAPIVVTPQDGAPPYVAGTLKISHGDKLIASVDFHTSSAGGFPAVDTPQEMKANAELIVRAVNAHADLVAALKSAEGALGIARNVMGVHELQDSRWDTARTIAEKTINEIRIALENLR